MNNTNTFRGFVLDPFQVSSINAVNKDESVIVAAPTGCGKTLIAEYLIEKELKSGRNVIYTAPIKALSNQKFRDLNALYPGKVGIMTGDVVINPSAPVRIMTTEVLRNMLVENDPDLKEVHYIIFDEIHYINDIDRGVIWEESIIFSHPYHRFLALSATIPNVQELAGWIRSIHKHTIKVVEWDKRPVPLNFYFLDPNGKWHRDEKKLKLTSRQNLYGRRREIVNKHRELDRRIIQRLKEKNALPALYFIFSRKGCEQCALRVSKYFNFINRGVREEINEYFERTLKPLNLYNLPQTERLLSTLDRGIAFHHAGMIPLLKEMVEILYTQKKISILFTTETFAVGMNMPVKTAVFDDLEKHDGISFRYLHARELFQMAGRAGRRGIDKSGWVLIKNPVVTPERKKYLSYMLKEKAERIQSQFGLSYNSILNLIARYDIEEIRRILDKNFFQYQSRQKNHFNKKKPGKRHTFFDEFMKKKNFLEKLKYVKDNRLTRRGEFASKIPCREIEVTELVSEGIFETYPEHLLAVIIAGLVTERRKKDRAKPTRDNSVRNAITAAREVLDDVMNMERRYGFGTIENIDTLFAHPVLKWYNGTGFSEICTMSNCDEGDMIKIFRQMCDMMRQIRVAVQEPFCKEKMQGMILKIRRDVVDASEYFSEV